MKRGFLLLIVAAGLAALILAGCQSTSGPSIKVEDAWGRPSSQETMMGAFYLVVKNEGSTEDTLVGAATSACGVVELHESIMGPDNVMSMKPVEGGKIVIPAKGQVEFKPGGLHLMCINKMVAFNVGEKIPLTLKFEQAGELSVEAEIRQP